MNIQCLAPLGSVAEKLASMDAIPDSVLGGILKKVQSVSGTFLEVILAIRHVKRYAFRDVIPSSCSVAMDVLTDYVARNYSQVIDKVDPDTLAFLPLRIRVEVVLCHAREAIAKRNSAEAAKKKSTLLERETEGGSSEDEDWQNYFEALDTVFPDFLCTKSVMEATRKLLMAPLIVKTSLDAEVAVQSVLDRYPRDILSQHIGQLIDCAQVLLPKPMIDQVAERLRGNTFDPLLLEWEAARWKEEEDGPVMVDDVERNKKILQKKKRQKIVAAMADSARSIKLKHNRRMKLRKPTQIGMDDSHNEPPVDDDKESPGSKKEDFLLQTPAMAARQGEEAPASQICTRCYLGPTRELGGLIKCHGCPSVQHVECVGLEMAPEGEWRCFMCTRKKLLEELEEAKREEQETLKLFRKKRMEQKRKVLRLHENVLHVDSRIATPPNIRIREMMQLSPAWQRHGDVDIAGAASAAARWTDKRVETSSPLVTSSPCRLSFSSIIAAKLEDRKKDDSGRIAGKGRKEVSGADFSVFEFQAAEELQTE